MKNIEKIHNTLCNILDSKDVCIDVETKTEYSKDWSIQVPGEPRAVLFPRELKQVINIVEYFNSINMPFVPSGGRTGLSGGATALNNEVVISFDKMNSILDFDETTQTVLCEPGLITKNLQIFADENNLFFPVDFSSTGSSQIGGNIATNAGGIRVVKYGLTGQYIRGVCFVSGGGNYYSFNTNLIKNATGPDFKNLLIGSEGIFGLLTSCSVQLIDKKPESKVALVGFNELLNLENIQKILTKNKNIEAIEFFTYPSLKKVNDVFSIKSPFNNKYDYYLIIEYSDAKLELIFEKLIIDSIIEDIVVSQNIKQKDEIWRLRLLISESIVNHKPLKYDIAVPIKKYAKLVHDINSFSKNMNNIEPILFGHIGDGNLHANFLDTSKKPSKDMLDILDKNIVTIINDLKGTISAEHGIGSLKKKLFYEFAPKEKINLLKTVKTHLDPKNLSNPGKLIF
ncbi:MAG: FAD-binding oxidoreductase [Flavobacteriaceae bacterium]